MTPIEIILADQHYVVRAGLRCILERDQGFRIVGEADNGRDAVRLAASLKPDVLITDIPMTRLNGLQAVRQIRERSPTTKAIIFSALPLDHQIKEALESGVRGFIVKSSEIPQLVAMVRQVAEGKTSFSPAVARYIKQHCVHHEYKQPSGLTSREQEVIQLVGERKSNKEIAEELTLQTRTVDGCVNEIMEKLNMRSRTSLALYARESGICHAIC